MSKNNPKRVETITTDDGRELELKNLKISVLRRFMQRFAYITDMDKPDSLEFIDILTDCAAIALERQLPEETEYLKKARKDGWSAVTEDDREAFAELFDMDDISKINKVSGGVEFDDPNLPKEAPTATEAPRTESPSEDGTTSTSTA